MECNCVSEVEEAILTSEEANCNLQAQSFIPQSIRCELQLIIQMGSVASGRNLLNFYNRLLTIVD